MPAQEGTPSVDWRFLSNPNLSARIRESLQAHHRECAIGPPPLQRPEGRAEACGLTTSPLPPARPRTGTCCTPCSPLFSQALRHRPPEETVKQTELVLLYASHEKPMSFHLGPLGGDGTGL